MNTKTIFAALIVLVCVITAIVFIPTQIKKNSSPKFTGYKNPADSSVVNIGYHLTSQSKSSFILVARLENIIEENNQLFLQILKDEGTRNKILIYGGNTSFYVFVHKNLELFPTSNNFTTKLLEGKSNIISYLNKFKDKEIIITFRLKEGFSNNILECNKKYLNSIENKETNPNCIPFSNSISVYDN